MGSNKNCVKIPFTVTSLSTLTLCFSKLRSIWDRYQHFKIALSPYVLEIIVNLLYIILEMLHGRFLRRTIVTLYLLGMFERKSVMSRHVNCLLFITCFIKIISCLLHSSPFGLRLNKNVLPLSLIKWSVSKYGQGRLCAFISDTMVYIWSFNLRPTFAHIKYVRAFHWLKKVTLII